MSRTRLTSKVSLTRRERGGRMNYQFHAGHNCFLVLSPPPSLHLSVDEKSSLKKCLRMRENLLLQLL